MRGVLRLANAERDAVAVGLRRPERIDNKAALEAFIAADLASHGMDRWRFRYRLTNRIVYFQWLLRRSEYYANCRRDPIGRALGGILRLRAKLLGERLGFSIPINVFGPGLSIAHVGTVVVNPHATVGRDCRIHQGARSARRTVGSRCSATACTCRRARA